MICGLPIIATDCPGGNKEILDPDCNLKVEEMRLGEYGILIPTKNSEEISKAISLLLENENLRKEYAKRSFERAKDFSVEKIIPKWLEILK
jgi:glycosyltransferase involved in cell wall biosynthesis